MKKIIILSLFINVLLKVQAQQNELRRRLYKIEDKIISGDISALKEMGKFIDDTSFVQEFLGYHNYPNTAHGIAMRVIRENCLFLSNEISIDSTLTTNKFLTVLNSNKIVFDDLTGMFLVTDLKKRVASYKLKKISDYELKRIRATADESKPDWYLENQIEIMLLNKNPDALMWIASAWYKKRARFNRYFFHDEEFLDLMKKLTHEELGIINEKGSITFLYEDDYYAKARLNYLSYWVNHCKDYKWNDEKQYFENLQESPIASSKEEELFKILSSKNDSLAEDAFFQLTELDTQKVRELGNDYDRGMNLNINRTLPTFPFRFLKQMVVLTQYSRDNKIRYKAEGWLLDSLNKLKGDLDFNVRYRLENNIISNLDLKEVTCVEYFGLINEKNWGFTYSIGRILDKFYSKNWSSLINDKIKMSFFLKKSKLFEDLGIIGIVNKYLRKFENCSDKVLDSVKSISFSTNDADIEQQAKKVLSLYSNPIIKQLTKKIIWDGNNKQYGVDSLEEKYKGFIQKTENKDEKKWEIERLIGGISYKQIGEAIQIMEKDTTLDRYGKFHFIESDFGFDINSFDSAEIKLFLERYTSMSEPQLYRFYLKQSGLNCIDKVGNLIYPAVYDVLKYDVVDAFVGGGGSRRENGVYLVIKLLEFKFNTNLGFPKKLCSWSGMNGCDCTERAKAWMKFLEKKRIVYLKKSEPCSISFNE